MGWYWWQRYLGEWSEDGKKVGSHSHMIETSIFFSKHLRSGTSTVIATMLIFGKSCVWVGRADKSSHDQTKNEDVSYCLLKHCFGIGRFHEIRFHMCCRRSTSLIAFCCTVWLLYVFCLVLLILNFRLHVKNAELLICEYLLGFNMFSQILVFWYSFDILVFCACVLMSHQHFFSLTVDTSVCKPSHQQRAT